MKVENKFASVVFPKLISEGNNFILITFKEEDDDNLTQQIRTGGDLFLDEKAELDPTALALYLKEVLLSMCKDFELDYDSIINKSEGDDEIWPND